MGHRIAIASTLLTAIVVGGCASAPSLPYPAFIQSGDLEPAFTAALPGTRARQMFVDPAAGRTSDVLLLPADWQWNAGGTPGKTVEIYVLDGELTIADLSLRPGNYAYLPPGSAALPMSTAEGARLLYFLDRPDAHAVIRTPLFMSRDVVPWQPLSDDPADAGLQIKTLRDDPGSGARTWLLKISPGASRQWHRSSVVQEGFLLSGDYRHGECVEGEAVTGDYAPGGYFRRPPGIVNGGPESGSESGAVWLMREPAQGESTPVDGCPP